MNASLSYLIPGTISDILSLLGLRFISVPIYGQQPQFGQPITVSYLPVLVLDTTHQIYPVVLIALDTFAGLVIVTRRLSIPDIGVT
jgi:hypothetical protein